METDFETLIAVLNTDVEEEEKEEVMSLEDFIKSTGGGYDSNTIRKYGCPPWLGQFWFCSKANRIK